MRPVVWFSIFDWWTSSHGHSDFQLATRLARSRPVLFVNSLGLRIPRPGRTERVGRRLLRKLASASRGLRRPLPEVPGLAVVTLAAPPLLDGLALRVASAQLRLAMIRCGISDPGAVVTVPTALPLAERVAPGRLLYNRSDDHAAFAEAAPAVAALEARLLDGAQAVAYAARHLLEAEAAVVGARGLHLEHGVDPVLFHPGVAPDPAIAGLPAPRLGFFGALRRHALDFELLAGLSEAMPEASLVLMGDRSDLVAPLLARPNVHLFPERAHAGMPAAWAALTVALLPYRLTDWTRAIDPIKLRELLAMGLPVAATDIPAARAYAGRIDIAAERDGFPAAVGRALARPRPVAAVPPPTWDEQAARLAQALDALG